MKMRASVLAVAIALGAATAPAYAGSRGQGAAIGAGIGALGGAIISNGDAGTTLGGAAIGGLLGYGLSGDGGHRHDDGYYGRPRYQRGYVVERYRVYDDRGYGRHGWDRGRHHGWDHHHR
jgi:osmotically inducible lipoprotein OsmB